MFSNQGRNYSRKPLRYPGPVTTSRRITDRTHCARTVVSRCWTGVDAELSNIQALAQILRRQLTNVVEKLMVDNLAEMHRPGIRVVGFALIDAFPASNVINATQRSGRNSVPREKRINKIMSPREKWPTAQIYKITYPTGKIYIGSQPYLSYRYFGTPNRDLINEDFLNLPEAVRKDYTCRKEILWEKKHCSDNEMLAMERELILLHQSNNPEIGYNRVPKFAYSTT